MSTNYYGFSAGEDPANDEGTHLCLSSVGWEFLLQARPEDGIDDIHSWMRSLETFDSIRDEYGREISIDDLLKAIESRIELMRAGELKDRFDPADRSGFYGYSVQKREFRSGGAAFANYSFC